MRHNTRSIALLTLAVLATLDSGGAISVDRSAPAARGFQRDDALFGATEPAIRLDRAELGSIDPAP